MASAQESRPEDNAHAGHGDHVPAAHDPVEPETAHSKKTKAMPPAVGHQGMHHDAMPEMAPGSKTKAMPPAVEHQGMHHDAMPEMAPGTRTEAVTPADDHQGMHFDTAPHTGHDRPQAGDHAAHPDQGDQESAHAQHRASSTAAPSDARDPHAYSDGYGFGPLPPPIMADEESFAGLLVDRLESLSTSDKTYMTYDLQGWFGQTYNRALIRAEGDIDDGRFQNARSELLWAHAADANWDTHLGVRYDTGFGPDRAWLATGVQGFAPYWIYVEATAYVGEQDRTAFRVETEYDILLTQKLILQPRIEANFYGKRDVARALGHGLSDFEVGFRLHYEIRRELAPYIGIEWASKFGDTADYLRAAGNKIDETRAVAGVQFWF